MQPDFTETQELLQSTMRQYLADEIPFDRIREHEEKLAADTELWKAMAGQGWLGIPLAETVGGGGAGLVEAGIFVHELARRACVVPAAEVMMSALILSRHADGDESELLSVIVDGHAIVVPAVLEADDEFGPPTAKVEGGSLSGEKHYVDYADTATHHLVSALGPEGPGLYLVERSETGIQTEALRNTGRTPQAIVHYARVPARRVAGEDSIDALIELGRALSSVQILACMEISLEQTVAYTNVRKQFGQPLAAFQAVQHHAANMAMHVESSRFMVYELLDEIESGRATPHDVALVKASVSRAVPEVTMLGHQLHGGQGLIEENDLYFFSIRGKDRALAWGSAEECLARVAEDVETPPRWL